MQGRSFAPLLDNRPYVANAAISGELTYHGHPNLPETHRVFDPTRNDSFLARVGHIDRRPPLADKWPRLETQQLAVLSAGFAANG